jgi:lycopene beta-cyclase
MRKSVPYTYVFIGLGCANSLLILELHRRGILGKGRILILEPDEKIQNDRTFCFWLHPKSMENYGLNELCSHSWNQVVFNDLAPQLLSNYRYYYLRADVLYAKTKEVLSAYDYTWKFETFTGEFVSVGTYVFDSRPKVPMLIAKNEYRLTQSFYGWLVRTEKAIFNPESFTMMDFSIDQGDTTQFLYILPFDENTALIEPTRFGEQDIKEEEAQQIILGFLGKQDTPFVILEKESSQIPMCSQQANYDYRDTQYFPTGSRAGQLKPSTGYSFARNLEDVAFIADTLAKRGGKSSRRIAKPRFVYFDRLLLCILIKYPSKGKKVFSQLFANNKADSVFRFLDERTTIMEECKIFTTLPIWIFLKAALVDFCCQAKKLFHSHTWIIWITLLAILFQRFGILNALLPLWIIGLLAIGIPHGALDHLHLLKHPKGKHLFIYVVKYLLVAMIMFGLWYASPTLAILWFFAFSSWHFGQSDLVVKNQKPHSFWLFCVGAYMLSGILILHSKETNEVLQMMHVHQNVIELFAPYYGFDLRFLIGILGIVLAFVVKSKTMVISILFLLLSSLLPLMVSFVIYFIFQHSLNGWKQLRKVIPLSASALWLNALPFTIGSIVLFIIGMFCFETINWAYVFIFLSALSFPHVYFMNKAYFAKEKVN